MWLSWGIDWIMRPFASERLTDKDIVNTKLMYYDMAKTKNSQ
jgi:hypothetical protein